MKKRYFIFMIFLITIFFLFPIMSKAKQISLCEYNISDNGTDKQVVIYYKTNSSDPYYLGWITVSSGSAAYHRGWASFNKVFSTSGDGNGNTWDVHLDSDVDSLLSGFSCPSYVYVDKAGFLDGFEMCFTDSNTSGASYCLGKQNLDLTGEATYALQDTIDELEAEILSKWKTIINNWIIGATEYTVNAFKNEKATEMQDAKNEVFEDFFGVSLDSLNGTDSTLYEVLNSAMLEDLSSGLNTIFSEVISSTLDLLDLAEEEESELFPNLELTEEEQQEREEIINNLEEMQEDAEENGVFSVDELLEWYENSLLSLTIDPLECDSLLGDPNTPETPAYYLTFAFKIIRYVAIILLIVLSGIDFFGAAATQDQDVMKKAVNKAIKRLIIAVIIWLLPYLIEVVLSLIHQAYTDFPECGVSIDY